MCPRQVTKWSNHQNLRRSCSASPTPCHPLSQWRRRETRRCNFIYSIHTLCFFWDFGFTFRFYFNFRAPPSTCPTPTLFCLRSRRTPSSPSWASCSSSPSSTSSSSSSTSSAAPWSRWSGENLSIKLKKTWKPGDGKGGSDPRERPKRGGGSRDGWGWPGPAHCQLKLGGKLGHFAKTSAKKCFQGATKGTWPQS